MTTFHTARDGRGHRRVFVNGNRLHNVLWADTARGIACIAPSPVRRHRRKRGEIYTRRVRGVITVQFN